MSPSRSLQGLLALLVGASGCDSPAAPAEAELPSFAQPPRSVEPRPPPSLERRVTHQIRMIGWHRFFGVAVHDAPWGPSGRQLVPGTESVEALGRTFERCSSVTGEHGERTVFCPDVGLVRWDRREGGYRVEERLIALRRGDVTWAEDACGPFHLLDPQARAALCEPALRTLGAGPRLRRAQGNESCQWAFTPDGRGHARHAVVTLRLTRGASDPGVTDRGRRRTWTASSDRWTASVEIDRAVCGERDGSSFAAQLLELAPDDP